MRRRAAAADSTDELARHTRRGVVTAQRLMQLGVAETTIYRRCRPGGPWQLLGPGIVLLSTGEPTADQRAEAALLHAGPDAVLTGLEACRRLGLRDLPAPTDVHVLAPQTRGMRSVGFIHVERTWRLPAPHHRDDFPVAPPARAVLDAARRLGDPQVIAAMLGEVVRRRMVLPGALSEELEAGCRKGTGVPRSVLSAVTAGVRSAAEFDAKAFWERNGLGPVEWNMQVIDQGGLVVAVVDALVRDLGFVWEIDSVAWHFATPEQVAATAARRTRLVESGLYVVSSRPVQTRDDESTVVREIRAGLSIAAAMPTPLLRFEPDVPRAS